MDLIIISYKDKLYIFLLIDILSIKLFWLLINQNILL